MATATGCGRPTSRVVEPGRYEHLGPVPPIPAAAVPAHVVSVIDGDTIRVRVDSEQVVVRLLGIDTPERAGGPRPPECFGSEASARMVELAPVDSTVLLSRDVETRDTYGRLLAWVHRRDGVLLNVALVESGHAAPLFFSPNDSLEPLIEAAGHRARRDNLGFWSACGGPDQVMPFAD